MTILYRRAAAFRRDVSGFTSEDVATRDRTAEEDFRVQRIGRRVTRFAAGAQTFPIAIRDVRMNAARRCAYSATVRWRPGDTERKTIVSSEVIDLRRGLVIPGAPRDRAVNANDRALIAGE